MAPSAVQILQLNRSFRCFERHAERESDCLGLGDWSPRRHFVDAHGASVRHTHLRRVSVTSPQSSEELCDDSATQTDELVQALFLNAFDEAFGEAVLSAR